MQVDRNGLEVLDRDECLRLRFALADHPTLPPPFTLKVEPSVLRVGSFDPGRGHAFRRR